MLCLSLVNRTGKGDMLAYKRSSFSQKEAKGNEPLCGPPLST